MATTLTSKGQVTIPRQIRDYLGLSAGCGVEFRLGPSGEVIVSPAHKKPAQRGKRRFDALRGTLKTGSDTDHLMALLRDYDNDATDPGFDT